LVFVLFLVSVAVMEFILTRDKGVRQRTEGKVEVWQEPVPNVANRLPLDLGPTFFPETSTKDLLALAKAVPGEAGVAEEAKPPLPQYNQENARVE
jgi:hypothetical protein